MSELAASPLRQLLRAIWPDNQSVSALASPGHKTSMEKLLSETSKTPNVRANPTAIYNGNPFGGQEDVRTKSPPVPGSISSGTSASKRVISPVPSPRYRMPPFYEDSIASSPSRPRSETTDSVDLIKGPLGVAMTRAQRLRQKHNTESIRKRGCDSIFDDNTPVAAGKSTASTPSTTSVTKVKKGSTSSARGLNSPVSSSTQRDMPYSKSCSPAQHLRSKMKPSASHERTVRARNGSAVDFTSKVTSNGTDPMLHLNFNVECPLPPGLVADSTPLSSKFGPDVYQRYGIPDPRMSPEDRIRHFQRFSLSPRIKSDLTAQETQVYVAVRMRPYTSKEKNDHRNKEPCIFFNKSDNTVRVKNNSTSFQFDSLLDSNSPVSAIDQERLYKCVGEPLVKHTIEGYNSCLFAYGQTGSGKTYSIAGNDQNPGIIPRLVTDLFNRLPIDSFVTFTYIEIYNDTIQDLLVPPKSDPTVYKIREHSIDGPYVHKLFPTIVESADDLIERWSNGNRRRQTASTFYNPTSSRSHALLQITVQQKYFDDTVDSEDDSSSEISNGERLTSKINVVDLAGSERSNVSFAGDRLREGGYINKSLFTLGKVITELSNQGSNGRKHIPYRDSPLTFLLKESLGGNSRTFMLATISPSFDCLDETLSTLRYAAKAKRIVNTVRVNDDPKLVRNRILEAEITRLLNLLALHKINPSASLPSSSGSSESNSSAGLVEVTSPVISPYTSPRKKIKKQDKATSPIKVDRNNKTTETINVKVPCPVVEIKPYKSTLISDLKDIFHDVSDDTTSLNSALSSPDDGKKVSFSGSESKKTKKDKTTTSKQSNEKKSEDSDWAMKESCDSGLEKDAPQDDWGTTEKSPEKTKKDTKAKEVDDWGCEDNTATATSANKNDSPSNDDWGCENTAPTETKGKGGKKGKKEAPKQDDWSTENTAPTEAKGKGAKKGKKESAKEDDWSTENTAPAEAKGGKKDKKDSAMEDDWSTGNTASAEAKGGKKGKKESPKEDDWSTEKSAPSESKAKGKKDKQQSTKDDDWSNGTTASSYDTATDNSGDKASSQSDDWGAEPETGQNQNNPVSTSAFDDWGAGDNSGSKITDNKNNHLSGKNNESTGAKETGSTADKESKKSSKNKKKDKQKNDKNETSDKKETATTADDDWGTPAPAVVEEKKDTTPAATTSNSNDWGDW